MREYNIVYDLDSLSHSPVDGVVLDISAFIFDTSKMLSDAPYTCKDLQHVNRFKLSVKQQVTDGLKVDKRVAEFWANLGDATSKRFAPKDEDLTITQFVNKFSVYVNSEPKIINSYVNNKSIQPLFLQRMFKSIDRNLNELLPTNHTMDMQSYIFAKTDSYEYDFCPIEDEEFWKKVYDKNNSSWDVIANVLRIQAILRAENNLEGINR
jgi:hypothetical protein